MRLLLLIFRKPWCGYDGAAVETGCPKWLLLHPGIIVSVNKSDILRWYRINMMPLTSFCHGGWRMGWSFCCIWSIQSFQLYMCALEKDIETGKHTKLFPLWSSLLEGVMGWYNIRGDFHMEKPMFWGIIRRRAQRHALIACISLDQHSSNHWLGTSHELRQMGKSEGSGAWTSIELCEKLQNHMHAAASG